ncbi:hypothetical protein IAT40_003625 [Kwoniella sp. CBS 6097]
MAPLTCLTPTPTMGHFNFDPLVSADHERARARPFPFNSAAPVSYNAPCPPILNYNTNAQTDGGTSDSGAVVQLNLIYGPIDLGESGNAHAHAHAHVSRDAGAPTSLTPISDADSDSDSMDPITRHLDPTAIIYDERLGQMTAHDEL